MLVTFKSKAAAEVVMYKEHAKPCSNWSAKMSSAA